MPIKEVLENFYRFADGCTLASYNLSFDWNFIESSSDKCGLKFDNKRFDILLLVREELKDKVSNYKLSTVAVHYGININFYNVLHAAKIAAKILLKNIENYFEVSGKI